MTFAIVTSMLKPLPRVGNKELKGFCIPHDPPDPPEDGGRDTISTPINACSTPFSKRTAIHCAAIRADLKKGWTMVDANDFFIAAHARA